MSRAAKSSYSHGPFVKRYRLRKDARSHNDIRSKRQWPRSQQATAATRGRRSTQSNYQALFPRSSSGACCSSTSEQLPVRRASHPLEKPVRGPRVKAGQRLWRQRQWWISRQTLWSRSGQCSVVSTTVIEVDGEEVPNALVQLAERTVPLLPRTHGFIYCLRSDACTTSTALATGYTNTRRVLRPTASSMCAARTSGFVSYGRSMQASCLCYQSGASANRQLGTERV